MSAPNTEMLRILFDAAATLYLGAAGLVACALLVKWHFWPFVVKMWKD